MNHHEHVLHRLMAPESVAIVGASDRNHYAFLAMRSIRGVGFDGQVHLVNRRGVEAFGEKTVTRCAEIASPVDAAYLCVPVEGVLDAAQEAIAAGIRNLVIVTSGFAEVGGEGIERENSLRKLCADTGTLVLGPNCLGFRNYAAKVALGSIPFVPQTVPGSIAVISASGSVASNISNYGIQQGVAFSHLIATGNEMNVTTADLIDYLVDVPEVRAIALFIEGVNDAGKFARAAIKALQAKKPIVALKIGVSPTTAAVAAAHTGAVVGDDRVFNAACERYAVVRVDTVESLVTTAATLAATGPLERYGAGFVSMSGGMCEIAADVAENAGVSFPHFSDPTRSELSEVLSDLGQTHNPLDLTGAAVRDESLWQSVPEIISRDPGIGLTLINWDVPVIAQPSMPNTLQLIGETLAIAKSPTLFIGNFSRPINEHGQDYLSRHGIGFVLPGIAEGLHAIGRLVWWSQRLTRPLPPAPAADIASQQHISNEQQALAHLARHEVPVVPQRLATTVDSAIEAARELGGPVALKVSSEDITHKTEVGGVRLNLTGDEDVGAGYESIMASVERHLPEVRLEGVLVAPMRSGGLELFVGIARDPIWGPVMAVGLGGVWIEALNDTALTLLPASTSDIGNALKSLRAAKLLEGYRGTPPVDIDKLAQVIQRIGNAALALGPDLAALEVNPLYVQGDIIEALDALVIWEQRS